jgi:hypothetical protein
MSHVIVVGRSRAIQHVRIGFSIIGAILSGLVVVARGQEPGRRPTEADLAACAEFARSEAGLPAYTERAPLSPFPRRTSAVGPWTGPVASFGAPRRDAPSRTIDSPTTSGVFGAGGQSQEAESEPGRLDPLYTQAFDACLRARGF